MRTKENTSLIEIHVISPKQMNNDNQQQEYSNFHRAIFKFLIPKNTARKALDKLLKQRKGKWATN